MTRLRRGAPKYGGQHALWLHELLKGKAGQEGQVNIVQGGDGWKTPEEAWMEDDGEAEEEALFVNLMWAETTYLEEEAAGGEKETEEEVLPMDATWLETTDSEGELANKIERTWAIPGGPRGPGWTSRT
jgi:hypothetical protein